MWSSDGCSHSNGSSRECCSLEASEKHLSEQGKTFIGVVKIKNYVENCFNATAREVKPVFFFVGGPVLPS